MKSKWFSTIKSIEDKTNQYGDLAPFNSSYITIIFQLSNEGTHSTIKLYTVMDLFSEIGGFIVAIATIIAYVTGKCANASF